MKKSSNWNTKAKSKQIGNISIKFYIVFMAALFVALGKVSCISTVLLAKDSESIIEK